MNVTKQTKRAEMKLTKQFINEVKKMRKAERAYLEGKISDEELDKALIRAEKTVKKKILEIEKSLKFLTKNEMVHQRGMDPTRSFAKVKRMGLTFEFDYE